MICSAGWVINEGRAQRCDPVVLSQGLPVVQRQKSSWVALIPTGILILWSLPIDSQHSLTSLALSFYWEFTLIFYLVQKTLHALYCAYLWLKFITNSEIIDYILKAATIRKSLWSSDMLFVVGKGNLVLHRSEPVSQSQLALKQSSVFFFWNSSELQQWMTSLTPQRLAWH